MNEIEQAYKVFHETRRLKLIEDVEKQVAKRVKEGFEASGAIVRESMFTVLNRDEYQEKVAFVAGWKAGRKV